MTEQTILEGDHDTFTDKNRRSHYQAGCRHNDCKAAASAWRIATPEQKAEAKADSMRRTDFTADVESPVTVTEEESQILTAEILEPITTMLPKPAAPRPQPISAIGASRRLQALSEMGYPADRLAAHIDIPVNTIWWLLIAPPAAIPLPLHTRIVTMFKTLRLSIQDFDPNSDSGRQSLRARGLADRNHWAGPFDWNDIDTDPAPIARTDKHRDATALAEAIATAKLESPEDAAAAATSIEIARLEEQARQRVEDLDKARTDLVNEETAHARSEGALRSERNQLKDDLAQADRTNEALRIDLAKSAEERDALRLMVPLTAGEDLRAMYDEECRTNESLRASLQQSVDEQAEALRVFDEIYFAQKAEIAQHRVTEQAELVEPRGGVISRLVRRART